MPKFSRKRSSYRRRPRKRVNKTKKMVTGKGPTLVEQIANGVGSVAKLATAVAPLLMAINTERKYFDSVLSPSVYNPGTNDSISNITGGISRGTADNERIGSSILAKDLTVKFGAASNFNVGSATPITGHQCRVTVLCWKGDCTINAPTISKIYSVTNNIFSPFNPDYTDQMVVIKDKFFVQNAQCGSANQDFIGAFSMNKYFKKLDWHIRWSNADDPTTNHIFVVFRSTGTSSTYATVYGWYSRLNFTDN